MAVPNRDRDIRWFALIVTLFEFVPVSAPCRALSAAENVGVFQFEINHQWITSPNIHFHWASTGISLWLVLLTTFLTPLCVLISWNSIHEASRSSSFSC